VKKNPKKHYNFDSDEKDFEIELDKVEYIFIWFYNWFSV